MSLWDLETVGIHEEDPIREAFQEEIVFTGERYSVKLPWTAGKFNVPENHKLAEGCLKGQLKRIRKMPILLEAFDKVIQKQKKMMELWYLHQKTQLVIGLFT